MSIYYSFSIKFDENNWLDGSPCLWTELSGSHIYTFLIVFLMCSNQTDTFQHEKTNDVDFYSNIWHSFTVLIASVQCSYIQRLRLIKIKFQGKPESKDINNSKKLCCYWSSYVFMFHTVNLYTNRVYAF